jgi:hypothetical protein
MNFSTIFWISSPNAIIRQKLTKVHIKRTKGQDFPLNFEVCWIFQLSFYDLIRFSNFHITNLLKFQIVNVGFTLKNPNFDLLKHVGNVNNLKFNRKNLTWFFHIGLAF